MKIKESFFSLFEVICCCDMDLIRKFFIKTTETEDLKNFFNDQTQDEMEKSSDGENCFSLSYPKVLQKNNKSKLSRNEN
jgi:hypothetical protein